MISGAAMEPMMFNPPDSVWRLLAQYQLYGWVNDIGLRVSQEIGFDPRSELRVDIPYRNRNIPLSSSRKDLDIYDPPGDGSCMFRYVKG